MTTRRPGTAFLHQAKFNNKLTRVIPFRYSTTQTYVLEFGAGYIRFFTQHGLLCNTGQSITSVTQANPGVVTKNAHGYSNGDRLHLSGPFGVFTLRESPDAELIFVGGGAGMAPILSLLRSMAERGIDRKATFYYGARQRRDLCFEEELRALEGKLPDFRYIPALSEAAEGDAWDGETGLITDVVKRLAGNLAGAHAYVCGPPPMVEAAQVMLAAAGVEEKRIYFDKFTTTAD